MLKRATLASLTCALISCASLVQAQQQEPAEQLVREVVYNEVHDHDVHGNWRYWVRQHVVNGTQLSEQVETHDGPVTRIVAQNGKPLGSEAQRLEQTRLEQLVSSASEQASLRQDYLDDEKRIGRVLRILPDAFLFDDAGGSNGIRRLRFRPNPNYKSCNIESRVFHALTGDLWIDTRMKRMVKLEGRMNDDLNFGFGLLGRVNKGSWFRMDRVQVSPTEWKTNQLEVHISGRAIMFKTIARETSETRGGFTPVPTGMTFAQGVHLLSQSQFNEVAAAQYSPAAYHSSSR